MGRIQVYPIAQVVIKNTYSGNRTGTNQMQASISVTHVFPHSVFCHSKEQENPWIKAQPKPGSGTGVHSLPMNYDHVVGTAFKHFGKVLCTRTGWDGDAGDPTSLKIDDAVANRVPFSPGTDPFLSFGPFAEPGEEDWWVSNSESLSLQLRAYIAAAHAFDVSVNRVKP